MDKIAGSQSPKKLPPLLVNIQSTNTQTLDFNGVKSRNVTCVEATNLFLIIGCASGTTYVFARESLKFLFVIGFKGGKVCSISCAPDESDVAIGSVRGKVSLYRLSPNLHVALAVASSPAECFRHLYAVPHHIDQEVTEMKWSPNGKYLFVGDSQGIVSQLDVGSLDEFPRPPPSQVILKVSNRVLQMDCTFPYLAVCCTSGVFLCDLEKEDFTRVKRGNKDIKATGLCFKLGSEPGNSKEEDGSTFLSRLLLLIGEFGTGRIHRSNMQGKIIATQKVKINTFQKGPAKIFNPKNSSPIPDNDCSTDADNEVTFSFGKLYSGESHYLVTLLNDRLFVIDSNSLEMLFWSEDFQRIHSLTMISNYMFIWNGNKLDIISFTEFRPYAMQLLNAGLHNVLERWTFHTLRSVGWRKAEEQELELSPPDADPAEKQLPEGNNLSIELFETLLGDVNCDDSLCSFLVPFLPFQLPSLKISTNSDNSVEETDPFGIAVEKFVQSLHDILKASEEAGPNQFSFTDVAKAVKLFYEEIGAEMPCAENNISLPKIISKAHTFLKQPQLVNLPELFEEHSTKTSKTVIKMTTDFLTYFSKSNFSRIDDDKICSMCFMDYNKIIRESGWFSRIGIDADKSFSDSILADALILVIPLLTQDCLLEIITSIGVMKNIENSFCTWIVVENFLNETQILPYAPLLRTLQSESLRVHPRDIFSHIYQDLLVKDISRPAKYLHHFVSAMIFTGENVENSKRIVLATLLSAFPFKNWPKKETIEKVEILCTKNPLLLNIYKMACLEDMNFPSLQLCDCRLPNLCTNPKSSLSSQKIIEEGILKVLAKTQLQSFAEESFTQNEIHEFAMKRLLLEPYFKLNLGKQLPEFVKTNLILRTGSVSLLSLVQIEDPKILQELMKEVKSFRKAVGTNKLACAECKQLLALEKPFQPLTEESFAMWFFTQTGSIHKLIELVGNAGLNEQSTFSLRFYQQLVKTVGNNLYF